jgi:hypothetical protein
VSISLFSQTSTMSAWQQMQDWHAKQREYSSQAESNATDLMSALTTSFSSVNDGLMQIIMNKAVASARQRVNERAAQSGVDLSV